MAIQPLEEADYSDDFGGRLEKCYSGVVYDVLRAEGYTDQIPLKIVSDVTGKDEEALRTENKVRTAILQGVDPVDASSRHRKF